MNHFFIKEEISPSVISEMENKLNKLKKLYPNYSIDKALICTAGASKALIASEYFEHILEIKKILH